MRNTTYRFILMLFLGLFTFEGCQSQPLNLTASVKGQQYGTIEVFEIVFAKDSLFMNVVETIQFAYPSAKSGAVDFPYRPGFGGTPSAHMGCTQTVGYPGGPAKLTFDNVVLKKGSTVWLRIRYSKNSEETDSFSLYYGNDLLLSIVPKNWNSWEDYHHEDFKVIIP